MTRTHRPPHQPPPGDPWWDRNGVFGAIPDNAEFLTYEQVDNLPVGVRVAVLWEGGNGPHEYVVQRDEYGTFLLPPHQLQDYALNPRMLAHQRKYTENIPHRISEHTNRMWLTSRRVPTRKD